MQQSRIDQHRRDPALHRVYVCRRSSTARGSTMPGRVSRSPAVQDYPRTSGRRGASPLRRDVPVPPPGRNHGELRHHRCSSAGEECCAPRR